MLHTAANSILNANRDMVLLAVSYDGFVGRFTVASSSLGIRSPQNHFGGLGRAETLQQRNQCRNERRLHCAMRQHLIAPGHYPGRAL